MIDQKVAAMFYVGDTITVHQTVPVFMKAKIPVVQVDADLDAWDAGATYPYLFITYPDNSSNHERRCKGGQDLGHD